MKEKILLVGNGMAGIRFLESFLKIEPERYDITVIGKERYPAYNRIMLSSILQGDTTLEDVVIYDMDWYTANGIRFLSDETVLSVHPGLNQVKTDKGRKLSYDHLVIASGSSPYILPVKGADKDGVMTFRTLQDYEEVLSRSGRYKKATVIGAGLLGLEAAMGLVHHGFETTVVHHQPNVMNRQLDTYAAGLLQEQLEAKGVRFALNKRTKELIGNRRVESIRFVDGHTLETDLVLMSVGIRPNIEFVKRSGLEIRKGIVVDDYMRTNIPNVYAIGECAEHRAVTYGLVGPIYEQASQLARTLSGLRGERYKGSTVSTFLKIRDIEAFSSGQVLETEETRTFKWVDPVRNIYKKIVTMHGSVVGAILYGDTTDAKQISQMVIEQAPVTNIPEYHVLSSDSTRDSGFLEVPDSTTICQCNGVTKGAITTAIYRDELTSVEEVKDQTKASSSCGGCRGVVCDLLEYCLNSGQAAPEPMCTCTTYSEQEIVEAIRVEEIQTLEEVHQLFQWKNAEGCRTCTPALTYYLGGSSDENQQVSYSLLDDGTHALIPKTSGGFATAKELNRITSVIERFNIPIVRFTEDNRIKLMGVQEEVLPFVLESLRAVWSHRSLSIKIHEGNQTGYQKIMRFIRLREILEQKLERLELPEKVEITLSGSFLSNVETDLMVVQEGERFEGHLLIEGESLLLFSVEEEKEILGFIGAFLQLYKLDAFYREKVENWVNRVGVIQIREAIFDEVTFEGLHEFLSESLPDQIENDRIAVRSVER
ncbi:nitrite reductase large subunit NirB [Guptibacillus hwajinpoensis]|uniref:nitrite reductase large subunit NirB n=1 Tax=Guptibacillus hwajinpoensis TaxID=208199 RepID=UPI0037369B34